MRKRGGKLIGPPGRAVASGVRTKRAIVSDPVVYGSIAASIGFYQLPSLGELHNAISRMDRCVA
jgi:hypothetical protein